jgi:hypothetical protein
MSYSNMAGDEQDAQATAIAAFTLAMNTLRSLRAAGVITGENFNQIVENAVAVSAPRKGSGTRKHLFENLTLESQERQDINTPGG